MKKLTAIMIVAAILAIATIIGFSTVCAYRSAPVKMPPNAFLVSVRACDVEDAWVLPFKVTTQVGGKNVAITNVAITHFTLSTFCQWSDWTTRTIRVEADGYIPREYTVSGSRDIIAVLYPSGQ